MQTEVKYEKSSNDGQDMNEDDYDRWMVDGCMNDMRYWNKFKGKDRSMEYRILVARRVSFSTRSVDGMMKLDVSGLPGRVSLSRSNNGQLFDMSRFFSQAQLHPVLSLCWQCVKPVGLLLHLLFTSYLGGVKNGEVVVKRRLMVCCSGSRTQRVASSSSPE